MIITVVPTKKNFRTFLYILKESKVSFHCCSQGRKCWMSNAVRELFKDIRQLQKKKDYIVGIDLSERMLKLARKNVPEGHFICMDIRNIGFCEKAFDAAVLSFCIVHLTDPETVDLLKRVSGLLKSGGVLLRSLCIKSTIFSRQYTHGLPVV